MLALFTEFFALEIFKVHSFHRRDFERVCILQIDRNWINSSRLQGLSWIQQNVVCLHCTDSLQFLSVEEARKQTREGVNPKPFKLKSEPDSDRRDRVFICEEVDGIRSLVISSRKGDLSLKSLCISSSYQYFLCVSKE